MQCKYWEQWRWENCKIAPGEIRPPAYECFGFCVSIGIILDFVNR